MFSHAMPVVGEDSGKDDEPLFDESKDACNDIDLSETDDDEIIVKR